MKALFHYHQKLQRAVNWLIALALMVLLIVILAQTFTRYVIFYSLPWSEELSRYLFVLLIMLGINIGITKNNFVRIDMIDAIIPDRFKKTMETFRDAAALLVAVAFVYSTLPMMRIGKFQKSPAMQIGMDCMYGIMFIGFLLALVAVVLRIVQRYTEEREG